MDIRYLRIKDLKAQWNSSTPLIYYTAFLLVEAVTLPTQPSQGIQPVFATSCHGTPRVSPGVRRWKRSSLKQVWRRQRNHGTLVSPQWMLSMMSPLSLSLRSNPRTQPMRLTGMSEYWHFWPVSLVQTLRFSCIASNWESLDRASSTSCMCQHQ